MKLLSQHKFCQCTALRDSRIFRCSAEDGFSLGKHRRTTSATTADKEAPVTLTEFGTLFLLLSSICKAALSGLFLQKLSENKRTSGATSCLHTAARYASFLLQKPPYNLDTAISAAPMETETKHWEQRQQWNPDTRYQISPALTKLFLSL